MAPTAMPVLPWASPWQLAWHDIHLLPSFITATSWAAVAVLPFITSCLTQLPWTFLPWACHNRISGSPYRPTLALARAFLERRDTTLGIHGY